MRDWCGPVAVDHPQQYRLHVEVNILVESFVNILGRCGLNQLHRFHMEQGVSTIYHLWCRRR